MRRPLLLICVVCCLLLSAITPLAFAEDRDVRWNQDSPAVRNLGPLLTIAQFIRLPLLDMPRRIYIFNDGPEPVGSSEEEEGNTEDESESGEAPEGGPTPMERAASSNLPGPRE
jgi:hypothetical protein